MLKSLAFVSLLGCVDVPEELESSTEFAVSSATAGATYQLVNQGGECVDVPSYSRASATRLQTHLCKRSGYGANQHVTFEAVPGGFRLRNVDSQLCFDLPSSATADGTYVQQSLCHAGQNQIWNTQDEPFGYVRITSALDASKCIHVDAAHQLELSRCSTLTASAKSFALAPVRTHYSIRGTTGQCLDMPGHAIATGATPQLFGCKTDGTTNQEWNFEPMASGTFRLRQTHAGKCLDLRGGSLADTTVIEQTACTSSSNQQWRFVQQTASQWKLQNVASTKCADFFNGALRQYTCSPSWTTQLFTFEPGISGAPLGMSTATPQFLPPATGPGPLWAVDPALLPPILDVTVLDNAAALSWTDANPTSQSYRLFVTETTSGNPQQVGEEIPIPLADHSYWVGRIQGRPLVPGRRYDLMLWAMGPNGVTRATLANTKTFTLPLPNVSIGTQTTGTTIHPTAIGVFSMFDFNNNGIVDGAPAGNGTFPRFSSTSGPQTISAVGNRYATANGLRANAIVGYLLQENGRQTFVAFHYFLDPVTLATRSVAVFYGDLGTTPGSLVLGSPSATVGDIQVTPGATPLLPTVVNGSVLVPVTGNGENRVVEFDFVTALDPG